MEGMKKSVILTLFPSDIRQITKPTVHVRWNNIKSYLQQHFIFVSSSY